MKNDSESFERFVYNTYREALALEEMRSGKAACVCIASEPLYNGLVAWGKRVLRGCALRTERPGFWVLNVQVFNSRLPVGGFAFGYAEDARDALVPKRQASEPCSEAESRQEPRQRSAH